ncbi:hypothetical protein LJR125_001855 [Pseudoxanthomonas sp. LjRoot125]|uniref:hypothetical protein n=1 Tax=Pseudoxanthomonas sp. LjRoot125 TaxID=3342258 RepID=UPI003E11CD44
MEENAYETLTFRAEISLDQSAMFGRPGFGSGIRPNHRLPGRDYYVFGQIDFIDIDWLVPSETCEATCVFVVPKQDVATFVPGFRWEFSEGIRRVGFGHILWIDNT